MWPYFSNVLIAGNVGIMVFSTVAVAPPFFSALPPEWSAAYVRKFFPRYFFFWDSLQPQPRWAQIHQPAEPATSSEGLTVMFDRACPIGIGSVVGVWWAKRI